MQYYVLVLMLILANSVYALCPVNENSVCTLSDSMNNSKPLSDSLNPNIKNDGFSKHLQPMTPVNPFEHSIEPNRALNNDSGCQFGKCPPKANNKLTPYQK